MGLDKVRKKKIVVGGYKSLGMDLDQTETVKIVV
jgi:hypothetical protein